MTRGSWGVFFYDKPRGDDSRRTDGQKGSDNRYTPPEAVQALMEAEYLYIPEVVWEPACGDGAISKVLEQCSRRVASSDIRDTGYGLAGVDFLLAQKQVPAIITNPPFSLAHKFIAHAMTLAPYVAFLLKIQYWNSKNRRALYNAMPCARIYPLTWRLDFTGQGAPPMDCAWYVWDRDRWGERIFQPLPKPHVP